MFKKDYWYAALAGLVTAFFGSLILTFSETPLGFGQTVFPLWSLFIILPALEFIVYFIASRLFSHILFLKQLGRFGIVGVMNFSVDTGIVYTLREWTHIDIHDPKILYLFVISAAFAITNSYFWQRSWTFSEKAPPSRKEFIVFVSITVLGIGVNSLASFAAVQFLSPLELIPEKRLLAAAKVLATLISFMWNFLGYKFFVFS